ncbi:DUF4105 domain-containing protein [Brucepastera parasyntrophica]|uniref:DUF4105 domain-containing protein n=1 Tax=Brucepastera parasyntrophica TaxID=2880008 RepID=UPI002108BB8B|nr:DUF4105 domain-containing protein [Brucepastera parasyntrophica]ULQ60998.1 DUF4105 domain-containing protein [Brucepastera parasyntrophica]
MIHAFRSLFYKPAILSVILVFSICLTAQASEKDLYEDLVFKILVTGPSDEIFIWWGHAALIIENTSLDFSRIYDWGIFSYRSDSFLYDWVRNKVRYRCAVSSAQADIYLFAEDDRDVLLYVLDLEPEKKNLF